MKVATCESARSWSGSLRSCATKRSRSVASTRSGLDATSIWEWGVIERVSTGLLYTEVDLQRGGREMLAVADRVAD